MNNREWFCLALRLLGVWKLIAATTQAVQYASYYLFGQYEDLGFSYAVAASAWCGFEICLSLGLLLFAPAIAHRCYPRAKPRQVDHDYATALLRVGLQLLGVYSFLLAMPEIAVFLQSLFQTRVLTFQGYYPQPESDRLAYSLIYIAASALLLIWNNSVIQFLGRLRAIGGKSQQTLQSKAPNE